MQKRKPKPVLKEISLDLLDPPHVEMRSWMEEEKFNELVDSIKKVGIIEPLIVRPKGEKYEVVVGDRRYEAAKAAGFATVPAVVRDLSDKDTGNYMLSENLIREDPNPYDTAVLLKRQLDQEHISQAELAERIGWSQQKVSFFMETLRMPVDLQEAVRGNLVGLHQARQLHKIDDTEQRKYYTRMCMDTGASVRTLAGWVQDYLRIKHPDTIPAQSGNLKDIPAPPPPMESRCFCCGETYLSESMVLIRVDPKCHHLMKEITEEVQRIEREESLAEEEAGEESPETPSK